VDLEYNKDILDLWFRRQMFRGLEDWISRWSEIGDLEFHVLDRPSMPSHSSTQCSGPCTLNGALAVCPIGFGISLAHLHCAVD
jgi:hypothetical protein